MHVFLFPWTHTHVHVCTLYIDRELLACYLLCSLNNKQTKKTTTTTKKDIVPKTRSLKRTAEARLFLHN